MQEHHMEDKHASTYILAGKQNGTLYTGVTSNLEHRIYEHKNRSRAWKIALIEKNNPDWKDLSLDFVDSATTAAARPSRRMTVAG